MLIITLGREIVYLEQTDKNPGVMIDTLKVFLDFYFLFKSEFKKEWFEQDKNLREINEIAEYFRSQLVKN